MIKKEAYKTIEDYDNTISDREELVIDVVLTDMYHN